MQVSVRTTDRLILQYGDGLGDLAGAVIESLDNQTAARVQAVLAQPNGGVTLSADHQTVTASPVPPPPGPSPADMQRLNDAVTMLNSPAVMADQPTRDAFARQIGVQPLVIPITQKATTADIKPLAGP